MRICDTEITWKEVGQGIRFLIVLIPILIIIGFLKDGYGWIDQQMIKPVVKPFLSSLPLAMKIPALLLGVMGAFFVTAILLDIIHWLENNKWVNKVTDWIGFDDVVEKADKGDELLHPDWRHWESYSGKHSYYYKEVWEPVWNGDGTSDFWGLSISLLVRHYHLPEKIAMAEALTSAPAIVSGLLDIKPGMYPSVSKFVDSLNQQEAMFVLAEIVQRKVNKKRESIKSVKPEGDTPPVFMPDIFLEPIFRPEDLGNAIIQKFGQQSTQNIYQGGNG